MSRPRAHPTKPERLQARKMPDPAAWLRVQSRAEQVAGYLREQLARGALVAPLPGTREWSRQLGVSRSTLDAAVKLLEREQWIKITAQGVALRETGSPGRNRSVRPRIRWLLESAQQIPIHNSIAAVGMMQNRVRLKGIEVDWELCRPARLREIARSRTGAGDLFILASLHPAFQRHFVEAGKPALVLGEVAAGLDLAFVNADLSGAVRHAVFQLLRAGCTRMELIRLNHPATGIANAARAFEEAVKAWPMAVPARVLVTTLDRPSLLAAMRRLVAARSGCVGCVVLAPVPVGMVVSALLTDGRKLPGQAKVAAVFHSDDAVRLCAPLLHYPWPGRALVAKISAMADTYFATGQLPASRTLPVALSRSE
jgi:hypothetical protein